MVSGVTAEIHSGIRFYHVCLKDITRSADDRRRIQSGCFLGYDQVGAFDTSKSRRHREAAACKPRKNRQKKTEGFNSVMDEVTLKTFTA
jgi:hypothetical protein